jgi:hypothetical protein
MTMLAEPPANGQNVPQKRESHAMSITVGDRGISLTNFKDLWSMAQLVTQSGLAPKGLDTPERAAIALEMGLELGMPPMASLRSIAVINGKPGIYGDAALALARGSGKCDYFLEFPSNDPIHALAEMLAACIENDEPDEVKRIRKQIAAESAKMNRRADEFGYTAISRRTGSVAGVVSRFTIGDAKQAKLWGKQGPWSDYPERMLKFRCRGFNLRDNFGDVLQGMVTAEEAGDYPPYVPSVTVSPTSAQTLPADRPQSLRDRMAPKPRLPDTQLPDEEAAERILREKSPSAQSHETLPPEPGNPPLDTVPGDPGPGDVPDNQAIEHGDEEPEKDANGFLVKLPPHAHTSVEWIDELLSLKAIKGDMSHKAARVAFHATDVQSWPNLTPERRQEKYDLLRSGKFPWKK